MWFADINMQALCKIPSHGSVDLHLKIDSISTAIIVPGGIPFNWVFVMWIVKDETEIWEFALTCSHIQNLNADLPYGKKKEKL